MVIEQRTLSNIRFGDNVGIWKGSIIYEILYLVLEAKAIVDFVARLFVVMAIFIEVSSGRQGIRHGCGV